MNTPKDFAHLESLGLRNLRHIYWNMHGPQLYEEAIKRNEGLVAHLGPLVVRTGVHTGRSPKDRFIVREPSTENEVYWGNVNKPFEPAAFDRLREKLTAYFQNSDIFIQDCFAGADEKYRTRVRIITEDAWHNLFARNMFRRAETDEALDDFEPDFTVINAPSFRADPEIDGTHSQAFVVISFEQRLVIIGGTTYAGEIKKSIFSVMNYILPKQNVLPMHCSANMDSDGNTAIFFGLSGTGKTTLSSDASRVLIGDDEHGWSDDGVFNFEGGCYAKAIRLTKYAEPEIYATTRMFGTILENVMVDSTTRRLDLSDDSYTENTRASYPISHIPNSTREGKGSHAQNVIFLTADAFGVLPPVSKLTKEQAMYHFLNGYTAKVAGTEKGVREPQATFSACFGEPFMPLHPVEYANLLGEKTEQHGSNVWLVNTGWTGGPYGVGNRMELSHTRAIINAILDGTLADVETETDDFFGLFIPKRCPGVPDEVLTPRATWANKAAYDEKAKDLAARFAENFKKYQEVVSADVAAVLQP